VVTVDRKHSSISIPTTANVRFANARHVTPELQKAPSLGKFRQDDSRHIQVHQQTSKSSEKQCFAIYLSQLNYFERPCAWYIAVSISLLISYARFSV